MLDVSANIHLFDVNFQAGDLSGARPPAPSKKLGVIVVAFVFVVGVVLDATVWLTSSRRSAEPASESPGNAYSRSQARLPRSTATAAGPLAPTIAPLPPRSHIEIVVLADDATVTLDGRAAPGNSLKLDVPRDLREHELEVSASGFAPLKRTVSFATDLYLAIELQRAPVAARAVDKGRLTKASVMSTKSMRHGMTTRRAHSAQASASSARGRSATGIDEADPYSPREH